MKFYYGEKGGEKYLAVMRTIKNSMQYLKNIDPYTDLTEHALRHMIILNKVPVCKVGNKYLLNMRVLENYLQGSIGVISE